MACTSAMRPGVVRCSRSRARAVSHRTSCAGTMGMRRRSCPAPACAQPRRRGGRRRTRLTDRDDRSSPQPARVPPGRWKGNIAAVSRGAVTTDNPRAGAQPRQCSGESGLRGGWTRRRAGHARTTPARRLVIGADLEAGAVRARTVNLLPPPAPLTPARIPGAPNPRPGSRSTTPVPKLRGGRGRGCSRGRSGCRGRGRTMRCRMRSRDPGACASTTSSARSATTSAAASSSTPREEGV